MEGCSSVYVYCHCAHPISTFAGEPPVGGEELHQVLCRGVSGRGDHCTGLYHFLRLFCQSASHWGYVLKCSDHCVELCRELVFNLLVLVGAVKASDRIVKRDDGIVGGKEPCVKKYIPKIRKASVTLPPLGNSGGRDHPESVQLCLWKWAFRFCV